MLLTLILKTHFTQMSLVPCFVGVHHIFSERRNSYATQSVSNLDNVNQLPHSKNPDRKKWGICQCGNTNWWPSGYGLCTLCRRHGFSSRTGIYTQNGYLENKHFLKSDILWHALFSYHTCLFIGLKILIPAWMNN